MSFLNLLVCADFLPYLQPALVIWSSNNSASKALAVSAGFRVEC